MNIAYFDESGDDGYPSTSSQYFILSTIYMHNSDWKDNYIKIYNFRKSLKSNYNLPIKQEFHTKAFIQDKNPYHGLYSVEEKKAMITEFFSMVATLKIKIINVAINKSKIRVQPYDVLENALKYAIQRLENDMKFSFSKKRFIIITDEGRVAKMARVSRSIQKINFIPSHYSNTPYREEIKYLIEDPLPKKSQSSYFIQICDAISYVINLHVQRKYSNPPMDWPKRVLNVIPYNDEELLLTKIKGVINLKASKSDPYGIVCYPK